MITLRCTRDLLRLLGETPANDPPAATATLGDWYAKPVPTASGDLVIFMSSATFLSVALPLEHSANLPRMLRMRIYNLLRHLDVPDRVGVAGGTPLRPGHLCQDGKPPPDRHPQRSGLHLPVVRRRRRVGAGSAAPLRGRAPRRRQPPRRTQLHPSRRSDPRPTAR